MPRRRRTPTSHERIAAASAARQRQQRFVEDDDEAHDVEEDEYAAYEAAAYEAYADETDPVEATIEFHNGQPIWVTFEPPPPPRRRRKPKEAARPFPWGTLVHAFIAGLQAWAEAAERVAAARAAATPPSSGRPPSGRPPPPPPRSSSAPPPSFTQEDVEDMRAAMMIGVPLNATEAEIRAAWRALVRDKLGREGFHDQGGDPEVTSAYVTAKNRIMARARRIHARR